MGLSRRRFALHLAAASGALTVSCKAPAETPIPASRWLHTPGDGEFDIPDDFLGLHSNHGLGGPTKSPRYKYDAIRSHDSADGRRFPALQWALIEKKPREYDWTAVDAWVAANPAKTRIFVLFGCPTFYQNYPGEPWRYPYLPGGGSPPKDPVDAARFVAALMDRHSENIDFLELWNEPNFGYEGKDPRKDRFLPNPSSPAFFSGTAEDLAGMARVVKRVLPVKVKLLSGAWEGQSESRSMTSALLRFADAPDGAGGTGKDHVDALSVHCYVYRNDPNKLIDELLNYRARFIQAGYAPEMPRYVSEMGAELPGVWTADYPSIIEKVQNIKRWCMIPAALGYKAVYLYKHSDIRTLGDPENTPQIGEAISLMRDSLRGKRVKAAAELRDQTIWIQFHDNSTIRG